MKEEEKITKIVKIVELYVSPKMVKHGLSKSRALLTSGDFGIIEVTVISFRMFLFHNH